jgi:hypothetical protein
MTANGVSRLLPLLRVALLGSTMFVVLGVSPATAQFLCTNFTTGDTGFSTAPGGGSKHVGRVGMAVEF